MNRRRFSFVLLAAPNRESPVCELGARRELFLDRFLIERTVEAELRLAAPVDAGPALQFDRPWEGAFCGYATVIRDEERYHLYYRGLPAAGQDGSPQEVTCYAHSRDGIAWTKPSSNVILSGEPPFSHNFSPFLDRRPGAAPEERFKALAGTGKSGLVAFVSADGVRWRKLRAEAVFSPPAALALDSQNVSFWSEHEQQYLLYYRSWKRIGPAAYRWISRATSPDFLRWSEPVEMDFGEAPPEHLYTNQTSPYFRAPHLYVAICARFLPGRQALNAEQARAIRADPNYFKDCSDAVLMSSRGGNRYDRTFLEAFLRPGLGLENWASRSNYPALNVVPTGPAEMSLYVTRNYGQPTAHLRRYTLRLDGFASLHASWRGGEMLTRPLRFQGRKLELNYSTSAAGGIRVEVQSADGAPLPGYRLEEAVEIIGDELARTVAWKQDDDVGPLAGRPVRLRFALKDADLFSFRFV